MTDSTNEEDGSAEELRATDDAALERLRKFGGGKLLGEMIRLFLANAPQRIAAARTAVEQGDANGVEMALHSLKSSSAQLGAMRMQRLSEQGESLARAGVLDICSFLVQDLEEEFTSVHAWLAGVREGITA